MSAKLKKLEELKAKAREKEKELNSKIRELVKKERSKKKTEITKFLTHLGMYDIVIDKKEKELIYGAVQETLELLNDPESNEERLMKLRELGTFKIEELEELKRSEAKKRKKKTNQEKEVGNER